MANKVFLVGAGPGEAELLTLRAHKVLTEAEIVFYDALVSEEVLQFCVKARKIYAGRRANQPGIAMATLSQKLIEASQNYHYVVHLKAGDPMLFARAQEEIQALIQANIEVEVVAGISAAQAASCALLTSWSARGIARSVAYATLTTEHSDNNDAAKVTLPQADTLIIFMVRQNADNVAKQLLQQGHNPDTLALLIRAVSTARQAHLLLDLAALEAGKAQSWLKTEEPVLMVVGDVLKRLDSAVTN